MANSIQYDYKILDRYSGPLGKIKRATDKMNRSVKKASTQVNKLGHNFKKAGDKMASAQNAIAGAGAALAIKALVSDSMKMEDAMADIAKVSSLTGKSLYNFRMSLEGLSEQMGKPAEGLAKIAFEGKKLGTSDKDLIPFIKTVAMMATAFDMSEETAGRAIGSIKAKLGLSMGAVKDLGDSLNYLADNTTANGENMVDIVSRVSGTFSILKVPPEVAAGFAAVADQLTETSELGASGLNMMFNRMFKMPGMTKKLMRDPMEAVRQTMEKFAKLPADRQPTAILKAFGPEAGRFVMKLVPKMKLFGETMNKAMDKDKVNSMNREMQNYLKRSSTKIKIANEKIRNSFRRLGDALTPFIIMFGNMISRFSKWTVKMSMQHPILMKIATGVLLLGATIPILMIPLGFLISAIGSLMTISLPVLATIGAIVAIIGIATTAFIYWYKSGHPVIETLKNIGKLAYRLIKPFITLFKKFQGGGVLLKVVGFQFKMIGYMLNLMLKPVEIILIAFGSLFDVIEKIINLDFKGALSSYMGAFEKAAAVFGFGGDKTEIESKKVVQSSVDVKSQSRQKVDVETLIKVAAEKGSKVVSAATGANVGTNMEFAN